MKDLENVKDLGNLKDLRPTRTPVRVCLPDQAALNYLRPLVEIGVEFTVWNGHDKAPPESESAEFIVAPYQGAGFDIAHFLAAFPQAKIIQVLSAGYDNWRGQLPDGVTLCNGRGVHTGSTAELALALTLAALRELPAFWQAQSRCEWAPQRTQELLGKRALIIGDGDIGHAVNRRLGAFDVITTRVASTARDGVHAVTEVLDLLPDADVVVLTVPLTESTTGLVDASFLKAMRDSALLVNVARGKVVDTTALVAELRLGRISAALDVVDPEPLPNDHPLWSLPNVLITPHVGGGTAHWAQRGYDLVRKQIRLFGNGDPLLNVVV